MAVSNVLSITAFNIIAMVVIVALCVQVWMTRRQVAKLEARLMQSERQLSREIKQVNHGAIGIGRRFSKVEKALSHTTGPVSQPVKKPSTEKSQALASVFSAIQEQVAAEIISEPPKMTANTAPAKQPQRGSGLTTKAEAALTNWLKEQSA